MCSKYVNLLFDYINKNTSFLLIPEFLAHEVNVECSENDTQFPGLQL